MSRKSIEKYCCVLCIAQNRILNKLGLTGIVLYINVNITWPALES